MGEVQSVTQRLLVGVFITVTSALCTGCYDPFIPGGEYRRCATLYSPGSYARVAVYSDDHIFVIGNGQTEGSAPGSHWIVRRGTQTSRNGDNAMIWKTVDDYQYVAGQYASPAAIYSDTTGVYVAGRADVQEQSSSDLEGSVPTPSSLGIVRKSTDGGDTWTTAATFSIPMSSLNFAPLAIAGDGLGRIYVGGGVSGDCGSFSFLRYSDDGGATWTGSIDGARSSSINALGWDSSSASLFMASQSATPSDKGYGDDTRTAQIIKSADRGQHANTVREVSLPNYTSLGIAHAFGANATTLYAVGSSLGKMWEYHNSSWAILSSRDHGGTWDNLVAPNYLEGWAGEATGIALSGSAIFVSGYGTDSLGVSHWLIRKSTDAGQTWKVVDDFGSTLCEKPANTMAHAVIADSKGILFAVGTAGMNVLTTRISVDDGRTWAVSDSYPNPAPTVNCDAYLKPVLIDGAMFIRGGGCGRSPQANFTDAGIWLLPVAGLLRKSRRKKSLK